MVKSSACTTNRIIPGTNVVPRDVLSVAKEAALRAGAELTERYGRPPRGLGAKQGPTDLVSDADRAAEAAIAAVLARRRPGDGILGEEGTANREGTTGLRWVVDPLDGTVNYLSGIPLWCVSIACEDAAGTLAGVVHDPLRGHTFAAVRGGPVQVDGPSTRERDPDDLAAAVIAGGVACATEEEAKRAAKLEKRLFSRVGAAPRARHRRAGARLGRRRADRRRLPRAAHPPVGRRRRAVHLPARRAARAPARAARARAGPALPRGPGRARRRGPRADRPVREGAPPPRRGAPAAQRHARRRGDAPPPSTDR